MSQNTQIKAQAPALFSLVMAIDARVELGEIPCPSCDATGRYFGELRHHLGCPLATLLNQLGA